VQLPEVERQVAWPEMREIALAAESVGLDSIWLGDHLLYRDEMGPRGPMEAWSLLAALGEATERVALGPLVAATSFHTPGMLAKKAATVDEISGGRLILGLGAGWNETEYRAFGFPYDHRVARFEEAFTIIATLVREGVVDFDGRFYRHEELELFPRPRRDMKIMIGSNGPRMLAIAAPHVDMWNSWFADFDNDSTRAARLVAEVDARFVTAGREPGEVEKSAAVYVQLGEGGFRRGSDGVAPIRGTRDDIAHHLASFHGVLDHLQVVLDPIDRGGVEELGEIVGLTRKLS